MAQKHRFRHRNSGKSPTPPLRQNIAREVPVRFEPKAPIQYGKAFVLLEDSDKNTFEFTAGAWVPYGLTIAQCRRDCLVKELPQKVNGRTRYEVRSPIAQNT
jgi:hypothetical protein